MSPHAPPRRPRRTEAASRPSSRVLRPVSAVDAPQAGCAPPRARLVVDLPTAVLVAALRGDGDRRRHHAQLEGELIPGLLQTEGYYRRLHRVAMHMTKPEEIDKFVAARMRRQSRLTDDEAPLNFSTVVSEAAFRRALGDSEAGPAQLRHVVELAQQPNVTLHMLPFAAGLHPSMAGSSRC